MQITKTPHLHPKILAGAKLPLGSAPQETYGNPTLLVTQHLNLLFSPLTVGTINYNH